jgi:hypothetical protein
LITTFGECTDETSQYSVGGEFLDELSEFLSSEEGFCFMNFVSFED